MEKLYNRTNWVDDNAPDIDAAHLNNIESGIDAIDNRVIDLNDGLSAYQNDGYLPNDIFSNATIRVGKAWNMSDNADRVTASISVSANTKYTFRVESFASATGIVIVQVDASGNSLNANVNIDSSTKYATFTSHANVKELRIQYTIPSATQDKVNQCKSKLFIGENIMSNTELTSLNNTLNDLAYGENAGGKNLFDKQLISNAKADGQWIHLKLKPNTKYTMSTNAPTVSGGALVFFLAGNVETGASSSTNGVSNTTPRTVTSDSNGYVSVSYRIINTTSPLAYNWQIEEGESVTSYVPFINSVKTIDESLNDYGMNNCVTEFEQGQFVFSTGATLDSSTWIRSKSFKPCKNGDLITIKFNANIISSFVIFLWNGSTFARAYDLSTAQYSDGTGKVKFTVPIDCTQFKLECTKVSSLSTLSPSQAGHIGVYVNNAIDQAKADLGGLTTQTVSGTCQYTRTGKSVTFTLRGHAVGSIAANEWFTVTTLPVGYRPPIEIVSTVGLGTISNLAIIRVTTDGVVSIFASSVPTSKVVWGSICFTTA